jgi:hypothetical protein
LAIKSRGEVLRLRLDAGQPARKQRKSFQRLRVSEDMRLLIFLQSAQRAMPVGLAAAPILRGACRLASPTAMVPPGASIFLPRSTCYRVPITERLRWLMTDADQFFCTRHLTPVALRFEHNSLA